MSTAKKLELASRWTPPATRFVELHGDYGTTDFHMHRGGTLPEVVVAYEAWGTLSEMRDNAVLVFTACHPPRMPARPTKIHRLAGGST